MQFEIGKGFSVENGIGSFDLKNLTDQQWLDARAEFDNSGVEKGLISLEDVGRIAVANTATDTAASEQIDLEAIREDLFGGVDEGANLYISTVKAINARRKRSGKLEVPKLSAFQDYAYEWLLDDGIVEATTVLPKSDNRPLLVIPQLSGPISHEETVDAWKHATNGKMWSWDGRMDFLKYWSADELSGYNPENEGKVTFAVEPTAYDTQREGTVAKQLENLEVLRKQNSDISIGPVSIFGGAVLAHRYAGNPTGNWRDTYMRAIELAPQSGDRCVASASVYDYGNANVDDSYVGNRSAARLQVESKV